MTMEKKSVREILAENIKRELEEQGLTTREFAVAVLSRSQVYDILAKRKGCTVDMIDRIASVLMVRSHELLQDKAVAQ